MNKYHYQALIAVILILFIGSKLIEKKDIKNNDVTVIIPEVSGGGGKEIDSIKTDTVYIEKTVNKYNEKVIEKIVVDSLYKKRYEDAMKENDSLKAKNIFLESIKINEFKGELLNDSKITIKGKIKTRGKLLSYDIDYTIKKDSISYTPKIEYKHPSLSLIYGAEVIVPTSLLNETSPIIAGKLGLQFKKGDIVTVGITSQNQILFGYSKTIKLFN